MAFTKTMEVVVFNLDNIQTENSEEIPPNFKPSLLSVDAFFSHRSKPQKALTLVPDPLLL